MDLKWINANPHPQIEASEAVNGLENYYGESCPNGALEVKSYKKLTYKNLFNGIDLELYETNAQLKYDYKISAGADYKQIQLEIKGATKIYTNSKGQLIIKSPMGDLSEESPLVFQNGKKLEATWQVKGNLINFEIKNINPLQPFIIDPMVRLWGTFYGGTSDDYLGYTAVDASNMGWKILLLNRTRLQIQSLPNKKL